MSLAFGLNIEAKLEDQFFQTSQVEYYLKLGSTRVGRIVVPHQGHFLCLLYTLKLSVTPQVQNLALNYRIAQFTNNSLVLDLSVKPSLVLTSQPHLKCTLFRTRVSLQGWVGMFAPCLEFLDSQLVSHTLPFLPHLLFIMNMTRVQVQGTKK